MLKFIDNWLNKTTMYRVVLYYLAGLVVVAVAFSFLGVLPYNPIYLLVSIFTVVAISWSVNNIFAWAFDAPANIESLYITAFILVLIITPLKSLTDFTYFVFIGWVAVWAMASKFILAIKKKHIFNPAALAVALTALTINQSSTWWIGTAVMLPFVLAGGVLVVRKIRRADLVLSYLFFAVATVLITGLSSGTNIYNHLEQLILRTPLLFFAFVMITEPLTTPPIRSLRIFYGALVGVLFAPSIHVGAIYSTPELALLVGNFFSYLISPKQKLILRLQERLRLTPDTYDFVFASDQPLSFRPGQYLEWTLPHTKPDSRGNRRYFTIASAPSESKIRLGVKFYPQPSSFKKFLGAMQPGDIMVASQLAGDFVLPRSPKRKLVFMAGGIGITPFRSMIKYLVDNNQARNIILFYSNKTITDIAYKNLFDAAAATIGLKTVYCLTDVQSISPDWTGQVGYINGPMIQQQVSDYKDRLFFLSGPRSMVLAFEKVLKQIGVRRGQIKTDYFPGFA